MAELSLSDALTLVELAKRTENDEVLTISEVLDKLIPVIRDAKWTESNGLTTHTFNQRISLPTVSRRRINEGTSPTSGRTAQVVENLGMTEAISEVDERLVDISPDGVKFRMSEEVSFIEALGQKFEYDFFYGSEVSEPEAINGIASRSAYDAAADANVEDEGGDASDCSSIYIVQWGDKMCHLVYPKGDPNLGIRRKDLGRVRLTDSNGKVYYGFSTSYQMTYGMCIEDDRCVQRIASIDTDGTGGLELSTIITALNKMRYGARDAVMYLNKDIQTQLDVLAVSATNVRYLPNEYGGQPVMYIRNVPVHVSETILSTETAL